MSSATDNSNEKMARFLDSIRGSYPYDIARSEIVVPFNPRYHLLVAGTEAGLTEGERTILAGIIERGLKIAQRDYELQYAPPEALEAIALASPRATVVVFGASGKRGMETRSQGGPVLFASALSALVEDPGQKRELWKGLQQLPA